MYDRHWHICAESYPRQKTREERHASIEEILATSEAQRFIYFALQLLEMCSSPLRFQSLSFATILFILGIVCGPLGLFQLILLGTLRHIDIPHGLWYQKLLRQPGRSEWSFSNQSSETMQLLDKGFGNKPRHGLSRKQQTDICRCMHSHTNPSMHRDMLIYERHKYCITCICCFLGLVLLLVGFATC